MARTLRFTPDTAVPVVVVILACVNVLDVTVPHASLVAGPVCAAGLIALARLAGLSWQDLGLGAGTWARGARWAAVEIAAVAVVFAVGAALPATRNAFRDSRYHLGWGGALLTAFVLIPVGTVLAGRRRPRARDRRAPRPRSHLRHAPGRDRLGRDHPAARLDGRAHRRARSSRGQLTAG